MEKTALKNRTGWMISAATVVFCMALGTTIPSQAADKVIVIPMGGKSGGSTSGAPASVAKTGQTTMYMTGDDGDLEKGVSVAGRFKDNGDGTVTDGLTGLIWLKDGSCATFFSGDALGGYGRPWADAIASVNKLANGYCGLTDGSQAGNWRLPNVKELQSLIDYGQGGHYLPALPENCPLADSMWGGYWSSTSTMVGGMSYMPMPETYAWYVDFSAGGVVNYENKSGSNHVHAVRGGK
jgi:hypothetical protein